MASETTLKMPLHVCSQLELFFDTSHSTTTWYSLFRTFSRVIIPSKVHIIYILNGIVTLGFACWCRRISSWSIFFIYSRYLDTMIIWIICEIWSCRIYLRQINRFFENMTIQYLFCELFRVVTTNRKKSSHERANNRYVIQNSHRCLSKLILQL